MTSKTTLSSLLVMFLTLAPVACGDEGVVTTPTAIPLLPTFALTPATPTPAPAEPTITPTEAPTLTPTTALTITEGLTATEPALEETPALSATLTPTVVMTPTVTITTTEALTVTATITSTTPVTVSTTITATETATTTPEADAVTAVITATTTSTGEPDFAGVYMASLPAASSPGRAITLTLSTTGAVTMTTDYRNDEPPIVEIGTWAANDDGTATVTLTGQTDRAYDEPETIQFAWEDGALVAIEYDENLYGEEDLRLQKQSESATAPLNKRGTL